MTTEPDGDINNSIEATSAADAVLPFADFTAPAPIDSTPPATARWLAFGSILLGGLLGGMIGFGTSDLLGFPRWVSALVAIAFAIGGAVGVGIVAQLTLRAMNEWRAVQHPEDQR